MRVQEPNKEAIILAAHRSIGTLPQNDFDPSTLNEFVNILAAYPKPSKKVEQNALLNEVAAYLFVSTARNTAKLAVFGCVGVSYALQLINESLSNALNALKQ